MGNLGLSVLRLCDRIADDDGGHDDGDDVNYMHSRQRVPLDKSVSLYLPPMTRSLQRPQPLNVVCDDCGPCTRAPHIITVNC